MTNRVLDISEESANVYLRDGLLVIRPRNQEPVSVPVADVAVIVASHREITISQAAIAALASAGGVLICCDEKHRPAGMLLPLEAHSEQAERYRKQVSASAPTKKRLWQELVRAKIAAQASVLQELRGEDGGLRALSNRVRSGDDGNLESLAAQRYWPFLFGSEFRRSDETDRRNRLLDYGYTVLRAACCRAICATGLHPTFGVHHRNKYNAFALADDFMEPCRPLIDRAVLELCDTEGKTAAIDRTAKVVLIGAVLRRYEVEGERRTLFDILARTAAQFASRFTGETENFDFPTIHAG